MSVFSTKMIQDPYEFLNGVNGVALLVFDALRQKFLSEFVHDIVLGEFLRLPRRQEHS